MKKWYSEIKKKRKRAKLLIYLKILDSDFKKKSGFFEEILITMISVSYPTSKSNGGLAIKKSL